MAKQKNRPVKDFSVTFDVKTFEVEVTFKARKKLEVMKQDEMATKLEFLGLDPAGFYAGIYANGIYFVDRCGLIFLADTMERKLVQVKGVPRAFYAGLLPAGF